MRAKRLGLLVFGFLVTQAQAAHVRCYTTVNARNGKPQSFLLAVPVDPQTKVGDRRFEIPFGDRTVNIGIHIADVSLIWVTDHNGLFLRTLSHGNIAAKLDYSTPYDPDIAALHLSCDPVSPR